MKVVKHHLWRLARFYHSSSIPFSLKPWLLDQGSLTQRLKQRCSGVFSVRVLQQAWQRPSLDEVQCLKMRYSDVALIREVQLLCDDVPLVFARTVIPVRSLSGLERRLAHLGNRPLGAFLFANASLQRGEMELACIERGSKLGGIAAQELPNRLQQFWGRRSVFSLNNNNLLVSEIFLFNDDE